MYFVSSQWLYENLNNDKLIILDTSLKPITIKLSGDPSEQNVVIPKTKKFDLNGEFSDQDSSLPHTLPKSGEFIKKMRALGISKDSIIIVYDNQGIYSSPRALYMIKQMGHKNVYILNGGLPAWIKNGFPTQKYKKSTYSKGNFSDRTSKKYFCDIKYVLNNFKNSNYKIIDARSKNRFLGQEEEPRPNLKLGHIPNSSNLPFSSVLNNGEYKDIEEIKNIFSRFSIEDKKLIFYCGSGVTSCILALASNMAGYDSTVVYDGSWSEWAKEQFSNPISKCTSKE